MDTCQLAMEIATSFSIGVVVGILILLVLVGLWRIMEALDEWRVHRKNTRAARADLWEPPIGPGMS